MMSNRHIDNSITDLHTAKLPSLRQWSNSSFESNRANHSSRNIMLCLTSIAATLILLLCLVGATHSFQPSSLSPSLIQRQVVLCVSDIEKDAFEEVSVRKRHVVNGVTCVEIPMGIPRLGTVVVLEAAAEAQELLVSMALGENVAGSLGSATLNSGDPYGTVLWPAAYAVAAHILSEEAYMSSLSESTICELGAGTGLVSLSLSLAGAAKVIATDYEDIPLQLIAYSAKFLNSFKEGNDIQYQRLDVRDFGTPLPPAHLVLAADTMYEPTTGVAMARRALEALKRGSRVVVGDSPGRPGRAAFLEELERIGVRNAKFVDKVGYTCSGHRHSLICGEQSTSVSETPKELLVAIMDLDPKKNL